MRTKTVNIYKFKELPEKVQEKIINSWRDNESPFFTDEVEATMKALEKALNVSVVDWRYDADNYNFVLNMNSRDARRPAYRFVDDILSQMPKKKYRKGYGKDCKVRTSKIFRYGVDDCPWTGVCYDCAFADALLQLRCPGNYYYWDKETFVNLVFDNLFSAAKKEYEYWLSEESIKEDIEAAECEFYEDGSRA